MIWGQYSVGVVGAWCCKVSICLEIIFVAAADGREGKVTCII